MFARQHSALLLVGLRVARCAIGRLLVKLMPRRMT